MSLSAAQVEQRRTGLGCSELYDLLPQQRDDGSFWYPRRYRLWHRKVTGKSLFTGREEWLLMGHALEDAVATIYAARRRQEGRPVRMLSVTDPSGEGITLVDPKRPWLMGTPDRLPVAEWAGVSTVHSLEDIWRLRDSGALPRGWEGKTGASVAEAHLDEEDAWGEGYRVGTSELVALLAPHCPPEAVEFLVRELLRRYTLQTPMAEDDAGGDEEWGPAGSSQFPRRHIVQCTGYMALTGIPSWDLSRLRAGGTFQSVDYSTRLDADLAEGILSLAERFVVDYLRPQRPPPQETPDDVVDEVLRLHPVHRPPMLAATEERAALMDALREACIASKRAEVREAAAKAALIAAIGEDEGIDGGKGFSVTFRASAGRVTVDGVAAVGGLVERLVASGVADRMTLEQAAAEALEAATRVSEGGRVLRRPQGWTKGIEAEVLAAMKEK